MSIKIVCPVCNDTGIIILKKTSTKTNGGTYVYKKWNVYHHNKRRWCYLNKAHLMIPGIRSAIKQVAQKVAQNNSITAQNQKNFFSPVFRGINGFSLEPGMGIEPMYSGSAAPMLGRYAEEQFTGNFMLKSHLRTTDERPHLSEGLSFAFSKDLDAIKIAEQRPNSTS